MPIYEYDCQQCGTFEVSQKMSEPALTEHAGCGARVERRMSVTSFAIKGNDAPASPRERISGGPPCGGGGCGGGSCGLA